MIKLKIKNFGPIINGYENLQTDDFFDVSKCSVFIGEQGTGKSTIAKLISTLLWLEKDIVQKRRDFTQFKTGDFIKLCKNQKINEYFKTETYICYQSYIFDFEYKDSKFSITQKNDLSNYNGKKIMYIPSERNLISVLDDVDEISGLPYTLQSTYEEFIKAIKKVG